MEVRKVKSAAKTVIPEGPVLTKKVSDTLTIISKVVGASLGSSGRVVLIERPELNLSPYVTKDGVTIFKSLGFSDPVQQTVLESVRDCATKTAESAGDGTTTSTILAESFYRYTQEYLKKNTKLSPQKVVREINHIISSEVYPALNRIVLHGDLENEVGRKLLHGVARVSANGDAELADKVMEAFDMSGDEGNITLSEATGDSEIKLTKIEGYPIPMGYEEACQKFWPSFINDPSHQRLYLENCYVILYFGKITEPGTIIPAMTKIYESWQKNGTPCNIILAATGFSEDVLGTLGISFAMKDTLKVVPLLCPQTAILNSQQHLLLDLAAFVTGKVFDPIHNPLHNFKLEDAGRPMTSFEMNRYRSVLIGNPDEMLVLERIEQLREQLKSAESKLDASLISERMAKLSGGIVKLIVNGSSNGETKERRDRAEDAICAVRSAIKFGCLPGGGYGLEYAIKSLLANPNASSVCKEIVCPALKAPVERLLNNAGLIDQELDDALSRIEASAVKGVPEIYDSEDQVFRNPTGEKLILDSYSAVSEAIKNSVSISTLLATLGGTVVFNRDDTLERQESSDTYQYLKDSGQLS